MPRDGKFHDKACFFEVEDEELQLSIEVVQMSRLNIW
jgi:hypothetical protein